MIGSINQLICFVMWFEDNFGDEQYLHSFTDEEWDTMAKTYSLEELDRLYPDGMEWRSYLELPEYINAKNAIEYLRNNLDRWLN